MADKFDAERFAEKFCRELVMAAAYWSDGPASRREKVVTDFATRLKPHLADRRAVEGLREAEEILMVPSDEYGPDVDKALIVIRAALAAAGEGEKMAHHCHATGCEARVPPTMFMCKRHWFLLPKPLRDAIWRTYRTGQCDDWNISHEYAEAARTAVRFVASKEGKEPNTSVYGMLGPYED